MRCTSTIKRRLFYIAATLSLPFCVMVCVLWVRAQSGSDQAMWSYDRYLSDRSAASNHICLTSDDRRLSITVSAGHVGPFDGQLVRGHYVNADQSGGRPEFTFCHDRYDAMWRFVNAKVNRNALTVEWDVASRTKAIDGDDFRSVEIRVAHWLVALVSIAPSMLVLNRLRSTIARNLARGYS